ncbi:hypothetical protein [Sphingomonas sp. MMS24-J13]|uniref:hypothetical protein n=1 Tax=Sphingomonas sp. MMS24-J13 TaxID=3238686 RepID=UPI003850FD9A
MAETIEEARVIAWLDGELSDDEAVWMARAVAADPALAAIAERHRRMKARFAAAFGPIAEVPAPEQDLEREPAPVISLAAVRAERAAKAKARAKAAAAPAEVSRWTIPAMVAASLIVGVLSGYGMSSPSGVADRPDALAVSPKIASALDSQLSGDAGTIRVALTFRDSAGNLCRRFAATHLSGIACRSRGAWQLRYASAGGSAGQGDYRMAGADEAAAQIVAAMIAGEPLDRRAETAAREKGWK